MKVKDLTLEQFIELMQTIPGSKTIEGKYDTIWIETFADIDGVDRICIDGTFNIDTELTQECLDILKQKEK